MSTTSIFVELLISGIQASVWISMLVISIFGFDWIILVLPSLEQWQSLITVIVMALWYTIGIVEERVASIIFNVFSPQKVLLKSRFIKQKAAIAVEDTRIDLVVNEGESFKYLNYYRSRVRIVRSTALNAILTTSSVIVFILVRCDPTICTSKLQLILIIAGIGVLAIILVLIVLGVLEAGYDARLCQVKRVLMDKKKKT